MPERGAGAGGSRPAFQGDSGESRQIQPNQTKNWLSAFANTVVFHFHSACRKPPSPKDSGRAAMRGENLRVNRFHGCGCEVRERAAHERRLKSVEFLRMNRLAVAAALSGSSAGRVGVRTRTSLMHGDTELIGP
jgi:hypothetical protein